MAEPECPAPHLLTLPREIRNHIYSYIVDENTDWRETRALGISCFQYRFHEAPQLSLLHTHPRLRAEYLEAAWTENTTASFNYAIEPDLASGSTSTLRNFGPTALPFMDLVAQHVKHITIVARLDQRIYSPSLYYWSLFGVLVDALCQMMSSLSTIRIGVQRHMKIQLQHHNNTYHGTESSLIKPLPVLEWFPLVQRAEGYRLEEATRALADPPRNIYRHRMVTYGCYLYTKVHSDYERRFWQPADVTGHFPLRPYSADWNVPLPDEILEHKMREWTEKRGHEEAVAWL